MKKIAAVLLSMVITAACLTACGDSSSSIEASKMESSSSAETTTTTSQSETKTTTTTTAETTTTTTVASTTTQSETTVPQNKNRVVLDVKNIQQKPELPTGSEITAATIALNYYGINVSKMELLNYLKTDKLPENGIGSNPIQVFVGDPKLNTGYGCIDSVIAKAVKKYFRAANISNFTIEYLDKTDILNLYKEIDSGNPIIIWATENMKDSTNTLTWTDYQGNPIVWKSNEHCVVLIGYDKDKDTVIVSDPLDPKGTVEYPRSAVEKAYNAMDKQALVIRKK